MIGKNNNEHFILWPNWKVAFLPELVFSCQQNVFENSLRFWQYVVSSGKWSTDSCFW
jgi:hypothetical protein